jgi:hypothetical protein
MRTKHLDSVLRQIYGRCWTRSESHQERLEARLTAQYVKLPLYRNAAAPSWRRAVIRASTLIPFVCAALLAAASQVPSQYSLTVGELLIVTVRPGGPPPRRELMMALLERAGASEARVRVHHGTTGNLLVMQLWGERLPKDLAARVRAAFPAAQVSERPLTGNVHGSLLDKLGYELLALSDPSKIEQLRATMVKELAARGESGSVDISMTDIDGRRQPRVLVKVPGRDGQ